MIVCTLVWNIPELGSTSVVAMRKGFPTSDGACGWQGLVLFVGTLVAWTIFWKSAWGIARRHSCENMDDGKVHWPITGQSSRGREARCS